MLAQSLPVFDEPNDDDHTRDATFIAALPVAVITLDSRGFVEDANKPAVDLLAHPLINYAWRDVLDEIVDNRAQHGHTVTLKHQRIVKVDMSPIPNRKGQFIVFTDLTETHQLHQKVAHLQRWSALGEMVAKLAHQIRTPLSAALLYSENLLGMTREPTMTRFTDKLNARLKELEGQVNDMLLFVKSGEHGVTEALLVTALIAQVEAHCAGILHKFKLQLRIRHTAPEHLTVQVNRTALVGAMSNLIHNAAQVSAPHDIISLDVTQQDAMVCVSVSDTGPGIPSALQGHIFTPFYTTKTHGTGLGLAVVRSVLHAHGGQVELVPCPRGATFCCRIPIHAATPPATTHLGEVV